MASSGLTRRGFLRAGAAAGVAAAAVNVLSGCTNPAGEDSASDPVVVDSDAATSVTDTYAQTDLPYAESNVWELPLGNVLHPSEGWWVPVTTAGASATPMVKASALSLSSGNLFEVVPEPITPVATEVIYNVRCSDSVYAWVELDYVTRSWNLYASAFSDGALTGETVTLWTGDANYDPAPFAVSGDAVIWQVQPALSGSRTTESSHLYLWRAGSSDARAVVESPGRFATPPSISGGHAIVVPRVNADQGVFYGITAYSLEDDLETQVDRLVLPQSVRPLRATRIGERFVFSIEASYGSGGLLGTMGTYIGMGDNMFVMLSREPSECAAGKGDVFVIKSRSSYFVVNTDAQTFSILTSADRSVDYGEFPARAGECDTFVTFATVKDADTGYPSHVVARTFPL